MHRLFFFFFNFSKDQDQCPYNFFIRFHWQITSDISHRVIHPYVAHFLSGNQIVFLCGFGVGKKGEFFECEIEAVMPLSMESWIEIYTNI